MKVILWILAIIWITKLTFFLFQSFAFAFKDPFKDFFDKFIRNNK